MPRKPAASLKSSAMPRLQTRNPARRKRHSCLLPPPANLLDSFPIQEKACRASDVGSIDAGALGAEAIEHFRSRMSIPIEFPYRNNCELWLRSREKLRS